MFEVGTTEENKAFVKGFITGACVMFILGVLIGMYFK